MPERVRERQNRALRLDDHRAAVLARTLNWIMADKEWVFGAGTERDLEKVRVMILDDKHPRSHTIAKVMRSSEVLISHSDHYAGFVSQDRVQYEGNAVEDDAVVWLLATSFSERDVEAAHRAMCAGLVDVMVVVEDGRFLSGVNYAPWYQLVEGLPDNWYAVAESRLIIDEEVYTMEVLANPSRNLLGVDDVTWKSGNLRAMVLVSDRFISNA